MKKIRSYNILLLAILTCILAVLNYVGSLAFFRLDLTQEKIHSLSPKTIEIVEDKIEGVINIEVLLDGEFPAHISELKNRIEEKLSEIKLFSNGKIQYRFANPDENKGAKENLKQQLIKLGANPRHLVERKGDEINQRIVWPAAIVYYNDLKMALNFVPGQSFTELLDHQIQQGINQIEYELVKRFRKITLKDPEVQRIAFIDGHGELDEKEAWNIDRSLRDFYNVERVAIDGKLEALRGFDAIVIAKPEKDMPLKDIFIIDQFIMKGGKTAWFIDPLHVNEDSLQIKGQTFGLDLKFKNIDRMLFKYGVRINKDLVLDRNCGPLKLYNFRGGSAPWYFFPYLANREEHVISQNLNPVKSKYASSITPVGNDSLKKTRLLETSDYTLIYKTPVRINHGIVNMDPNFSNANNKSHQTVAMLLEGKFNSYFKNQPLAGYRDSAKVRDNSVETKMMVVSDGDIIRNEILKTNDGREAFIQLEFEPTTGQKMYANTDFTLNAMDYLLGNEYLIPLRSRQITFRPLNFEKLDLEKTDWQVFNLILPILVVILSGLAILFIRKRKYAFLEANYEV